jgi:nicotinamidase/pyrazinamidase
MKTVLESGDALLVVDMQNDFLPGGSLAVPRGDEIIPLLNRYISWFHAHGLPVFATRDWHPPDHCSFLPQGGPWPPHCIAATAGAAFPAALVLPADTRIISKAIQREQDAYSGFAGTQLDALLQADNVRRLFVGGVATEYCVRNTVQDALQHHYTVFVLLDAVRALNLQADAGPQALEAMAHLGAIPLHFEALNA